MTVGRMTDEVREALLLAAHEMAKHSRSRKRFKNHICSGTVTTQGKYVTLGSWSGTEFSAIAESDLGAVRVRFLVDLSVEPQGEGFWVPCDRRRMANAAWN
jgi:hypothetical protein